ncbi:PREDICTED: putative methylesterase 13, chloroplastic isoform X2 [Tarenaya hassleriana]|uniref:putative methylesterase 13, chloroplastic isoform X2 n=1 Tax=Tarenaya hassleriana TaxID=28532 RepID=UPI0008FD90E9|nr:PREDICTED: putative methylesterase 13, chloroplastic isoform X2 [Tarenaya hassleriana]
MASVASLSGLSSLTMRVKPLSALSNPPRTAVPYDLNQGQNRLLHRLPSGLKMEVIEQRRKSFVAGENQNPPLVFVHGSYHAAWCWAEHWLPFFSSSGFDTYAVSLLGQGESDVPSGKVAGTLQTHASDIADFIKANLSSSPPVLIGHSFGGLIVQYYLANIADKQSSGMENAFPELSGVALVCSVPPSGNSGLVLRYLFTKPVAAFKFGCQGFPDIHSALPGDFFLFNHGR